MFSRGKKSTEKASSSTAAKDTPTKSVSSDAETLVKGNTATPKKQVTTKELKTRIASTAISLAGLKNQLKDEKTGKRKLYSSLVKLATELKRTRLESQPLHDAMEYANQSWYEGGMWRAPTILPGVTSQQVKTVLREATGLSGLFFNLVIVTAFTRVGISVADSSTLTLDAFLYFCVFWMIWTKDINYSTRFDSTDLSFEFVNLLSCIAVLFGSLSTNAPLQSEGGTRIMMMAGFVAVLHLILHIRVAFYYRSGAPQSIEDMAKKHAIFSIVMTVCETVTWITGALLPDIFHRRWIVFVVGIGFSIARLPKNFLDSDFHAASSKRGVLFILLLGFLLQSVVVVASPFFEYQSPKVEEYGFIGACCLMLYGIKLLYSDDAPKTAQDHALLVNGISALCFNIGQFTLLLSTTVLGSGLDLLTHSYLAATSALPHNAKEMVCGGFGMVVFSIFFIKSMHLKRIPVDGTSKVFFVCAYATQILVNVAVVTLSISLYMGKSYFEILAQDEITLMVGLAGVTLFLVILSWLDEAVELALYTDGNDSRQALVHPFGLWWCLAPEVIESLNEDDEASSSTAGGPSALSSMTPLLGKSVTNMTMPANESYDSLSSKKLIL